MALLPPSARTFVEGIKSFGLRARRPLATKAIISSSALEPGPPAAQRTLRPACGQLPWTVLEPAASAHVAVLAVQRLLAQPPGGETFWCLLPMFPLS